MAAQPVTITDVHGMRAVTRIGPLSWIDRTPPVDLRLPCLSREENALWQARFNALSGVCGCMPGAFAAVAVIAWQFGVHWTETVQSWQAAAAAVASVVGAALLVKLAVRLSACATLWVLGLLLVRSLGKPAVTERSTT